MANLGWICMPTLRCKVIMMQSEFHDFKYHVQIIANEMNVLYISVNRFKESVIFISINSSIILSSNLGIY